MTREWLFDVAGDESRAALVEDGRVVELHAEYASHRGLVGNVYKGRVQRVLPGMQAAFVECGLERTGFLHADDVLPPAGAERRDIRERLSAGEDVVVQVQKDPVGSKGARLTMRLSLPSQLLVRVPAGEGVGVSARIEDEAERARLRAVLEPRARAAGCGFIVRTAARGASEAALLEDAAWLERLGRDIELRLRTARVGDCLYSEPPLAVRLLRDGGLHGMAQAICADEAQAAALRESTARFLPHLTALVTVHHGARPLFEERGIEEAFRQALDPRVSLPSGGYLVIDSTEAMTTIDVNTGAFVGATDPTETLVRTNLEAARAIARELRLRNIGGLVVVDFIDMSESARRAQVEAALRESLAGDRMHVDVAGFSAFGMLELARQRARETLEQSLCRPCPTCRGRGHIRRVESLAHDVLRDIVRIAGRTDTAAIVVLGHAELVDWLGRERETLLAPLQRQLGRELRLQAEPGWREDQYDLVAV